METSKELNTQPSIFDFDNYREFLSQICFPNGRYQHSKDTLHVWSQRLGYKSPSSLAMVINGTRYPSREMINALSRILNLPNNEKLYMELQIDLEKCHKKGKDPTYILDKIARVYPHSNHHKISLKEFSTISKWYFLVIKQLISSPLFKEDISYIFLRLKKKITPSQIQFSLETMEELNIIGRDHNQKLIVLKKGLITTNDISSAAIIRHHHGMIQRAVESLEEDTVHERQISSLTFSMPKNQLPKAKEKIFKFLREFNEEFSQSGSEEVYQLNLQMFSHTKPYPNSEVTQ
jgi:uncharacterized protein (TIGR02147 family)